MNFNINRQIWLTDKHTNGAVSVKNECCDQLLIDQINDTMACTYDKYPDIKTGYEKLSELCDVNSRNLYISFGSSDVIKDILTVLKFDTIQMFSPGFALTDTLCRVLDKTIFYNHITHDDNRFTHEDIIKIGGDVLYLINPHCPTCIYYSPEDILKLSESFKYIILDEAYSNPLYIPDDIYRKENIIIIKTFSKLGGVPGMRLGFCHADEIIIDKLMCVKPMYEMTSASVNYLVTCSKQMINQSIRRLSKSAGLLRNMYPDLYVDHRANFCLMRNQDNFIGKYYEINNNLFTRVTLLDPTNINELIR